VRDQGRQGIYLAGELLAGGGRKGTGELKGS
jgi:hypothetical protein